MENICKYPANLTSPLNGFPFIFISFSPWVKILHLASITRLGERILDHYKKKKKNLKTLKNNSRKFMPIGNPGKVF